MSGACGHVGRRRGQQQRCILAFGHGSSLHVYQPLAPVSERRQGENRQRAQVTSVMRAAAEGRCARCRRLGLPVFGHERLNRSHGGDILNPDCMLCNACNTAIEDSPGTSCWNGWKISPKHPHDPVLAPWEARDLSGGIVDFRVLRLEDGAA